jgi:hypothetical protein
MSSRIFPLATAVIFAAEVCLMRARLASHGLAKSSINAIVARDHAHIQLPVRSCELRNRFKKRRPPALDEHHESSDYSKLEGA